MRIYVAHSREFDFKNDLYTPLRRSALNERHTFILPHENSDGMRTSQEFFRTECDLVIAEVSFPSTGLGIELGWADALKVPIVCTHKAGSTFSGSLRSVCSSFLEYSDADDLIAKIESIIER